MQHITNQGIHFNPVNQSGCFENCVNLGVDLDGPYVLELERHLCCLRVTLVMGVGGLVSKNDTLCNESAYGFQYAVVSAVDQLRNIAAGHGCVHGGEVHSSHRLLLAGKLWPDGLPVVWKQVFASDNLCVLFNRYSSLCGNRTIAGGHLRKVGKWDAQRGSKPCRIPSICLDIGLKVHFTLAFAKV